MGSKPLEIQITTIMGKGSLFFGFLAGSALTAAAAYVVLGRELERLQKKERKRLLAEGDEGNQNRRTLLGEGSQRSVRGVSAVSAVAATGEHVGFLTDIMKQLWNWVKQEGQGHKVYVLIDEYDHFTNEMVAYRFEEFKKVVGRNGWVRKFYEFN